MDKQIVLIKCRKCGYKHMLINHDKVDLFPTDKVYGIEAELKNKTLFE